MTEVSLVFPHQLFEENPCIHLSRRTYLIEEHLFFRQYAFHKKKLAFHRASMKFYNQYLDYQGIAVKYIESIDSLSDVRELMKRLTIEKTKKIHMVDPVDDWLTQRIKDAASDAGIAIQTYDSPSFLNSSSFLRDYFKEKKRMFQTDFYKDQRKKRNVLIDSESKPSGGKWTYDAENRLKYPKGKTPPSVQMPDTNAFHIEAEHYVKQHFNENPGIQSVEFTYPVSYNEADKWLEDFLKHRFEEFGPYEDAIVAKEKYLNHSVLSPLLNVGLLTPEDVIKKAISHVEYADVPINSLEGFIRQIMGWREFIRAVYILEGRKERTKNFWGFSRKIPSSFWSGETGIFPVDNVISKVLETGYVHHIERLMVLGNFMMLCEFDPDEVYQWFMQMFVDAYDWVMVPNVYGMSQFADGGIMSTKPYISGSNYLMKMSNYPKGEWQKTWDSLFWRFISHHRDFFSSNPRLGMMVRTFDRMSDDRKKALLSTADSYLASLDEQG